MGTLNEAIEFLNSFDRRVDDDSLAQVLNNINLAQADIQEWYSFSDDCYKRNTISRTDWYELLLLCWKPGQTSTIHDHTSSTCGFRVIEGRITEELFTKTHGDFVVPKLIRYYPIGTVCVSAHGDIHQIRNDTDKATNLVTLHIYSPPLKMNTYRLESSVSLAAAPNSVIAG